MHSTPSSENETEISPASVAECLFLHKTRTRQQVARLTADITDLPEALLTLGSMSETRTDRERCVTAMELAERLIIELDLLLGLGWRPSKPSKLTTESTAGPEKS